MWADLENFTNGGTFELDIKIWILWVGEQNDRTFETWKEENFWNLIEQYE